MAVHTNDNKTYYINPSTLTFVEDSGYGPNLIQVSASSSCYISVYDPDNGITYSDADKNYRRWKVTAYNNKFPSNDLFYIYVRLERNGSGALIVYSQQTYHVDGSSTDGTVEASDTYYYIRIGEVSATDGTTIREISYDTGYLESDQGKRDSETPDEMWELDKYSSPWLIRAKYWLESLTVKGIIRALGGIIFRSRDTDKLVTDVKRSVDSDEDVPIADTNVATSQYVENRLEELDEKYLRKDQDDRTEYSIEIGTDLTVDGNSSVAGHHVVGENLEVAGAAAVGGDTTIGGAATIQGKASIGGKTTAKGGLQIGDTFIPGILTGKGGYFDSLANGEIESLIIRRFLEVPELRFNRVEIKLGDKWNAPGAGIFEDVTPDENADGTLAMTGTGYLKLEDGEYGAIAVGDICMGIFHSEDSNILNATEDSDDSKGNFQFAGFYTCYFRITEIVENTNNKQFRYAMRPVADEGEDGWKLKYHPSPAMHFVSYGSFTREDRQTSVYTTRTYTRLLWHQNDWEIKPENIAMQYGNMDNMVVHGLEMSGYSMYLNNIYMTGVIRQIKPNGDPILAVNERGAWKSGESYDYYDRVSHLGGLWLCVDENGTDTEPSESDEAWLLQVEAGKEGAPGVGVVSLGAWKTGMTVPVNGIVTMGGMVFIATKETTNPPIYTYTDNASNRLTYVDNGYILTGELNEDDYDLLIESPKDGADGTDYEYIYTRTATDTRPSTPSTSQKDDFVPAGWYDDPIGVTEDIPYEWVSLRTKKDGMWSNFSTPSYWVKWARDGENAILADLDNEMDNVPLDSSGNTTSATDISITAAMYYGSSKQTLTGITVSSVDNITSSYDLSTGVITLHINSGVQIAERNEINITVKSDINGVEESRTLKFTLAGVKSGADGAPAVLYDIMVSESAIVKKKDGSYNVESVSATRYKTMDGVMNVTTDGTLKYSIDGGTEDTVSNGWPVPSTAITKSVKFFFYNTNGELVDVETVPLVVDGTDGEDGENGEGFTLMGNWKTGLDIPRMGVVTMAGNAYASKVATTNPPLWTWTDNEGDRLTFSDGGYILTGEQNTTEYELWVESGKDGTNGVKGDKGDKGDTGDTGPQGGIGYTGCVTRSWVGYENTRTYRNDTDADVGSLESGGIRYQDWLLIEVSNEELDSYPSGYAAYECLKTNSGIGNPHTMTFTNNISQDGNWQRVSDLNSLYVPKLLAITAQIRFASAAQLTILNSENDPCAGLSGSTEGDKIRIWAGSQDMQTAPFRVNEEGESWMTNAHVSGEIEAGSMSFKTVTGIGSTVSMENVTLGKGTGTFTLPAPHNFRQVYIFSKWAPYQLTDEVYVQTTGDAKIVTNASDNLNLAYVDSLKLNLSTMYTLTCLPNTTKGSLSTDDPSYLWVVSKMDLL